MLFDDTTTPIGGEEIQWQTVTKNLAPGNYTFRWIYEKDAVADSASGYDAGWIDNVKIYTAGEADIPFGYPAGTDLVLPLTAAVIGVALIVSLAAGPPHFQHEAALLAVEEIDLLQAVRTHGRFHKRCGQPDARHGGAH